MSTLDADHAEAPHASDHAVALLWVGCRGESTQGRSVPRSCQCRKVVVAVLKLGQFTSANLNSSVKIQNILSVATVITVFSVLSAPKKLSPRCGVNEWDPPLDVDWARGDGKLT